MLADKITNAILRYFFEKNLKPVLSLSIDECNESTNAPSVQVQINVPFSEEDISNFCFFYALDDPCVNMSAIYFLKKVISQEEFKVIREKYQDAVAPFSSIIFPDDSNEQIHLYKELPLEEFSIEFLDTIYKFFTEKNEATDFLNSISIPNAMPLDYYCF